MKLAIIFFYIILFSFFVTAIIKSKELKNEFNLMPFPAQIVPGLGEFRLADSFAIAVSPDASGRLVAAANRAFQRLAGRTGLFFSQGKVQPEQSLSNASMIISCQRRGALKLNEDESYELKITLEKIELTAETDIGVLRGLETFLQLLQSDAKGYFFPTVIIKDQPRFPWRGLLIDACRHFMPVEVIKRNLDGMAAVKLNVLHWHLTEDQGFRVECRSFPGLHEQGSDGFYYTQAQIKEVIDYAADRGIRVMPEFDIPGHTTSWFVAYPELASAPGPYTIERKWGIKDPAMDPTREETYQFLDTFFKEMTQLFPDDYLHIGGDEVNGKQWDANPEILAFMKAQGIPDNHDLQSNFNKRVLQILAKYGKKLVGWDEILHPDMPNNIVIQSWRGREALIESAQKGYQGILSNGYYIDLIQPTDFHYLTDPLPEGSPLTDAEKRHILGGEATMWSEYVSFETIDSRIWPRTAAIAERLWSPAPLQDIDDMYRRLDIISFRLEELGLLHEKNYEMMLRRLTNNQNIQPLKTLVDVLEPVKHYRRGEFNDYTSFSPLTRVVDVARPDAKVARIFKKLVSDYLAPESKTSQQRSAIEKWLELWKENHAALSEIIKASPVLREIESLSKDLSLVASIGLAALESIEQRQPTNPNWVQEKLDILEKAKNPRGETELMILPAIEQLVNHSEK